MTPIYYILCSNSEVFRDGRILSETLKTVLHPVTFPKRGWNDINFLCASVTLMSSAQLEKCLNILGGTDAPCAAWPMQFACFQNESKVNKYLSFICLIGFLSTLQVAPLSSTGTTSCFLPNIPQATHCCLSLEIKRKKNVSGVWPKIVPPYSCKEDPCGSTRGINALFSYMWLG